MENRFDELVDFLRKQIGEHKMAINRETLIEDDLGVSGDDASDLIKAFSEKYNVDVSDFNFEKYFYDEPGAFNMQNRSITPLNIEHLEKAIIAGHLNEDVING